MTTTVMPPIHPGEILMEEFLEPLELSQYRLAMDISVPPRRINEIVHGKRAISADTALRLARYFGTTDRFWLNLQRTMTWRCRGIGWGNDWRPRCAFWSDRTEPGKIHVRASGIPTETAG